MLLRLVSNLYFCLLCLLSAEIMCVSHHTFDLSIYLFVCLFIVLSKLE